MNGEDCESRGFAAGDLTCAAGCTFDTSGCHASRFEDSGVTIIDFQTGLEWEKKRGDDMSAVNPVFLPTRLGVNYVSATTFRSWPSYVLSVSVTHGLCELRD